MKFANRSLLLSAGLMLASALSSAQAGLIVLGDSTVDAGNAQIASQQADPTQPGPTPAALGYFQGRFSNGLNAADFVSQALGLGLTTASFAGGTNFAFGGAAIIEDVNQGPGGLPAGIPDLANQVDALLGTTGIGADDDIYVSFGGNDFLAAAAGVASPDAIGMAALGVITEQLRRLADAGATNVAVSNVNAVGLGLGQGADVGAGAAAYNAALAEALVQLTLETGTRFALADRNSVFASIFTDPIANGFNPATLTTACLAMPADAPACDGYVFFDPIHVTEQTQRLIGDVVFAALVEPVPLPAAAFLFATGFGGFVAARKRKA